MRTVVIGDLLISKNWMEAPFHRKEPFKVFAYQWPVESIEELQKINLLVEQKSPNQAFPDNINQQIIDADPELLLVHFYPVSRKLIEACPNLKTIGVFRGGIENVDESAASRAGIDVINTSGRNARAVAEFTIGMMFAALRNIGQTFVDLQTNAQWRKNPERINSSREIQYLTFGIVGFGKIGQLVAQLLRGLGAKTIYVYEPFQISENSSDVCFVDLPTLLSQSDVVSLHARLTEGTKHLIGAKELAMMKSTSYLINTARSGLINEEALIEVLKSHRIAGAALDTFDLEPLPKGHPICTLDNVVCTPHIAGSTKDAFQQTPVKWLASYLALKENKES